MPILFEYLGIIVFFYSNEHVPIHVHGKHQGKECKAEFVIAEGELVEIRISAVRGKRPLEGTQLRDFRTLVEHYANDIIQMWIDFFVFNRRISPTVINRRIK